MLSLIFQNLISNAIDYTPHGKVTVAAHAGDGAAAVECWVGDNGAGIPVDRLEKVFDKLESDPGRRSGMGLGLAIVRHLVELHGSTVRAESGGEGQGSTFTVLLPVVPLYQSVGRKERVYPAASWITAVRMKTIILIVG